MITPRDFQGPRKRGYETPDPEHEERSEARQKSLRSGYKTPNPSYSNMRMKSETSWKKKWGVYVCMFVCVMWICMHLLMLYLIKITSSDWTGDNLVLDTQIISSAISILSFFNAWTLIWFLTGVILVLHTHNYRAGFHWNFEIACKSEAPSPWPSLVAIVVQFSFEFWDCIPHPSNRLGVVVKTQLYSRKKNTRLKIEKIIIPP